MAIERSAASASVGDVIDRILDKGVVIDAWARVCVLGIEVLSIEVRAVVASVAVWLDYARAVGLTAIADRPAAGADAR